MYKLGKGLWEECGIGKNKHELDNGLLEDYSKKWYRLGNGLLEDCGRKWYRLGNSLLKDCGKKWYRLGNGLPLDLTVLKKCTYWLMFC